MSSSKSQFSLAGVSLKKQFPIRGLHVIALTWIYFSVLNSGLSQFLVSGSMDVTIFRAYEDNLATTFTFSGSVGTNTYRFTTISAVGFRAECSFDGSKLTTTLYDPHLKIKNDRLRITNAPNADYSYARVETNAIPADEGTYLSYLWMAYASRRYIDHCKDINPIGDTDVPSQRLDNPRVPFTLSRYDDADLLRACYFLSDGVYHGFNRTSKEKYDVQLPAPFGDGYTNAFFVWNSYTNISGNFIPTDFLFVRYGTPLGVKTLSPRKMVHGNATFVSVTNASADVLPQTRGIASVYDYRYPVETTVASSNVIRYPATLYKVTNGQWLSGSDLSNAVRQYKTKMLEGDR